MSFSISVLDELEVLALLKERESYVGQLERRLTRKAAFGEPSTSVLEVLGTDVKPMSVTSDLRSMESDGLRCNDDLMLVLPMSSESE